MSEWNQKEAVLKAMNQKELDRRTQVEKQMYSVEFLVKEKQAEVDKLKSDFSKER